MTIAEKSLDSLRGGGCDGFPKHAVVRASACGYVTEKQVIYLSWPGRFVARFR